MALASPPAARLQRAIERHYILRKLAQQPLRLRRAALRLGAGSADYAARPPVLVNSFPKSGTHLLLQILRTLPDTLYFGSIVASMHSSLFYRPLSPAETRSRIGKIVPGEVVAGHLFHDPAIEEWLAARHVRTFFIYRDLRDVVVSDAHYLREMNRLHRLHRYFVKLPSMDDAYRTAIAGIPDPAWEYGSIAERFAQYQGWVDSPRCCAVRYEDLMVREPATFLRLARFARPEADEAGTAELAERFRESIRPEESHTFRRGETGGWRARLKPDHVRLLDEVAGGLLADLDYR